jgi:hypothetical protein
MEQIIGYCGIVCSDCPAFIATQNNDAAARIKTAEEWSKQFNDDIKPENINCEGCHAKSGVLFNHCNVCEIRNCGLSKNITSCAVCKSFSCQKLDDFHKMVPDAKKILDHLKSHLK